MHPATSAVAVVLVLTAFAPSASAQRRVAAIEHDGVRYGEAVFAREESDGIVRTQETARIGVRTMNAREWRSYEQRSSERSDGTPLSLWQRAAAGPSAWTAEARIDGERIELRRREGLRVQRTTLATPPDLLVDAGLQRRIAAQPAGQPWAFSYSEVDLSAARITAVRLSSSGVAIGDRLELLRESDAGDGRSRRTLYWSLSQQRLLPAWNLAGARFDSRACDTDCADAEIQHFDLLAGLTVASPYHVPAGVRRRTLRYVFESADGAAPELPGTGEQAVVRRGNRSVVTICADCGDEPAPDAATLARYRAANAWVQSDHPNLRSLARNAAAFGTTEARMNRLVRFVQGYMTGGRQTLGYASALQAAETRSGDCTEFAVLLAALARAQQLPARVVGGLLYSSRFTGKRDVFSPHAWVQVWNGSRWVSFDAGVGDFDSTHIVLAIGDGSVGDYAGVLERVRALRLVAAAEIRSAQ
ncbi:MAG TPA: transglutaminase-like domain-containing protein [Tahibacter sp.]|uniref:transglutaminase-like domain-containing protein n=1 Tax=Tahibacter sp. TaxID=2056211 RepID=UPI002CE66B6D|nr:transglutaminase-like domain-containing protein [Tahibacter sp.]HSX62948.1 transglutaminase-like domain-containing protein [Tahibacter sp.]